MPRAKKPWPLIPFTFLVLIGVIIIGYFSQRASLTSKPSSTPAWTPPLRFTDHTIALTTLGPISIWKMYTTTDKTMSMKIPPGAVASEHGVRPHLQINIDIAHAGEETFSQIHIVQQTVKSPAPIRDWVASEAVYLKRKSGSFVDLKIGDSPALQFNVSTDHTFPDAYILQHGNDVFIAADNANSPFVGNRDAILKGILSTLEYNQ